MEVGAHRDHFLSSCIKVSHRDAKRVAESHQNLNGLDCH